MDSELREQKRRLDEAHQSATAGEWRGEKDKGVYIDGREKPVFETGCGCCTQEDLSEADAAFIALIKNAWPAISAALDRAVAENAEQRASIQHLIGGEEAFQEKCALADSFVTENAALRARLEKAIFDIRHYPGISPCHLCKHRRKLGGDISPFCKLSIGCGFEWDEQAGDERRAQAEAAIAPKGWDTKPAVCGPGEICHVDFAKMVGEAAQKGAE